MSYPYRLIRPDDLVSPDEMEPAVVLRQSLEKIAALMASRVGEVGPSPIFHDRDSDALCIQVADVPLVFVSFHEEPREVHVYVADRNVQGANGLLDLLDQLPLSGIEGGWWTREDQPHWPGNNAEAFVIGRRNLRPPI